jgi:hypothetical protein
MNIISRIQKWWLFNVANPVIRKGEHGGFKWKFRRFWLEVETLSGNWKARWIAAEHPYGYLLASKDDSQIEGFCQIVYSVGMLLTTEQGFVNDVVKALKKYDARLQKSAKVEENETEEKMALEEVKQVQELVEMPKKERKKVERDIDGHFKKAVKEVRKNEG